MPRGPKPKPDIVCPRCLRVARPRRGFCQSCYTVQRRAGTLPKQAVEALDVNFDAQQLEVLTGHMLGDGCLYKDKPTHKPYLSIRRKSTDFEYNLWTAQMLGPVVHRPDERRATFDVRTQKTYHSSVLISRRHLEFEGPYRTWYPDGIKVVPEVLTITATVAAVWFADDGSLSEIKNDKLRSERWQLKLATNGFIERDVRRLAEQLNICLPNGKVHVNRDGDQFKIVGADEAARAFAEYIAPVYPKCMNRKAPWLTRAHFFEYKGRNMANWRALKSKGSVGS